MEILRGLGLDDEVHAVADRVSDMVVKPTLNSAEEKLAIDIDTFFAGLDQLSPEPAVQYCPQSSLEPMLLAETRRHGNEVRYGTELCSLDQDDTGVTAVLRDLHSGESETVRADYLVAADGVHSPVRNRLGLTTSGHGALPIYVVFIYFRGTLAEVRLAPERWRWRAGQKPRRGRHIPGSQGRPRHVHHHLLPRQGGDGGTIHAAILPRGVDQGRSVSRSTSRSSKSRRGNRTSRWPTNSAAGESFSSETAAHTMPPFKAGGANTAIQSAHNLAWKLAAVLDGTADPALLTTFHAERHPVGRFAARQSLTGPTVGLIHLEDEGPGLPPEEEASMFSLLVGYQYRSAAVVTDQPTPADPDAVSLVEELRGQPGTRVPHAWVQRDGRQMSTLDLLGHGFTLLTAEDGAPWAEAAAAASAALGVPIAVHQIGRGGDALDPDGAWAQATGLAPGGALLVRPDDFVGWRADRLPADPEQRTSPSAFGHPRPKLTGAPQSLSDDC